MADQRPICSFKPAAQRAEAGTVGIRQISTRSGSSRSSALLQANQLVCFANASRAPLSRFQFGAYLSATSYLARAAIRAHEKLQRERVLTDLVSADRR
jgi:hypothetical protein